MNKNQIQNYLNKLNIKNDIKNLEDIKILINAHLENIPFTNIPVLLKNDLSLDIDKIYSKLVEQNRGGYCFEQNKLIFEVLKSFGFKVSYFLARVVNNQDIQTPKTHRFTLLEYEGERYILEVGFGYFSPFLPIKFGKESTYSNVGRTYKINEYEDGSYSLDLVQEDGYFVLYKFDLTPCFEVDFEMGHFYSHSHKNAVFVNNLVLSTISKDVVKSLRNNFYFKIYKDKEEQIAINSIEKLQEIINKEFNYPISDDELKYIYDNFVI